MSQQINLYEERLRPRLELATGRNLAVAALALVLVMAGWSLWEGAQADRKATAAAALSQEVGSAQEKMKALFAKSVVKHDFRWPRPATERVSVQQLIHGPSSETIPDNLRDSV